MEYTSFDQMDLSDEIMRALAKMGMTTPTSVQKQAIPLLMDNHCVIAKAPTGTGKTFAFGIPILEYLNMDADFVQALILCPTRELALQICTELRALGAFIKGLKICGIIGGQKMDKQIQMLKKKPHIVVATPGRLLDHVQHKNINISDIYTLVLDEADKMLDMGFIKDIRKIMKLTPPDKQIAMFSATMSREVMNITWEYMDGADEIEVAPKEEDMPKISQYILHLEEREKMDAFGKLMETYNCNRVMAFCNTKTRVRVVTEGIKRLGYKAECLHGDIGQGARNRIMDDFRKGKFNILVATDVAARGIDVSDIDTVFNFEVPNENEYYLHRIGRTGRAGRAGQAFTFVNYAQSLRMDDILHYTKVSTQELDINEVGKDERED
ncbi:MAG: DEAD/DEAH box helicase [Clostridiales bacterium]|nr:DEAD/DEAH box helicase [Clostridiales bacterium]MBO4747098.1 DEAD/DEAH box helicase [Clostridiales bacterium]MBR5058341.1 DEAD/DEAH box helicase [Clostridiales bacterium]MBR5418501.1 DEAD/DEAH box helicase [Clostridiales bacterium]